MHKKSLPIVETQLNDVSAFIPTNVISITDGQIYLDTYLFVRGVIPAINFGISVSRVGSSAQFPLIKKYAATLKLELAQYRELEYYANTGTAADLDDVSQFIIDKGLRMVEILKQEQHAPLPPHTQLALIYAATSGVLTSLELTDIQLFRELLIALLDESDRLCQVWNIHVNDKSLEEQDDARLSLFVGIVAKEILSEVNTEYSYNWESTYIEAA